MDIESAASVGNLDETLKVSNDVTTNTVKREPSLNRVQLGESTLRESFLMTIKTEKPEKAQEAKHGEEAGREDKSQQQTRPRTNRQHRMPQRLFLLLQN